MSEKEASLMILSYFNRFDLSIVAQEKLLELIHILLPSPNNLPKTLNKLKKKLNNDNDSIKEKFYCDNCISVLSDTKLCLNNNCSKKDTHSKTVNSFTYLNFLPRLTRLIKNHVDDIESFKNNKSNFKDLIDSEHYKVLNAPNQLSLMVYSDGISVSKSYSHNFWPVIIGLCELPLALRDSIKNKIVCGVWFGKNKPTSDILFSNLIEEINFINQTGICIVKNLRTLIYNLRIYGILCDTPAKSMILNMNQFNGYYGCTYCLNPGNKKKKSCLFILNFLNKENINKSTKK